MFPTEQEVENRYQQKAKLLINGQHYVVSTVELAFKGLSAPYETMVFACDAEGEVTNWSELYCDTYDSEEEARKGHEFAIKTFHP